MARSATKLWFFGQSEVKVVVLPTRNWACHVMTKLELPITEGVLAINS